VATLPFGDDALSGGQAPATREPAARPRAEAEAEAS
jgi:hypothetical protein